MHIERITSWSELEALQTQWNALAGDIPFRSWDWLATWWKHYGSTNRNTPVARVRGGRQLYVVAVYEGEAAHERNPDRHLIGIAPWYVHHTPIKGRVIRWLGSGEVCTDHLSLICQPTDAQ